MAKIEMDWSIIDQIPLAPDDPREAVDFKVQDILVYTQLGAPRYKKINFAITQRYNDNTVGVKSSLSMDIGNGFFNPEDYETEIRFPQQVLVDSLSECLSKDKQIVECEKFVEIMGNARRSVIRKLWESSKMAFIPEHDYQYANGIGTISVDGRNFGSFKVLKFTTGSFQGSGNIALTTMPIKLMYMHTGRVPETVDVSYALKDDNAILTFLKVKLVSSAEVEGFKIFDGIVNLGNVTITKIREGSLLSYPEEIQELTEKPKALGNNSNISRRMSSINNTDEGKVERAEVRTDSVRSKFKKLAQI